MEVWRSEQIAAESTSEGMTVISMLLNVERSPNVFVYVGQLICDSARGRPTGRLKSLVMPEIIIMSLQLVSVEKQSMRHQVRAITAACAVRLCTYSRGSFENTSAFMCMFVCGHAHVLALFFSRSLPDCLCLISASTLKRMFHDTH